MAQNNGEIKHVLDSNIPNKGEGNNSGLGITKPSAPLMNINLNSNLNLSNAAQQDNAAEHVPEFKMVMENHFRGLDDRLLKKSLIRYLEKKKLLDKVQSIYKPENSNMVTIITRDIQTRTEINLDLISAYYIHLVKEKHIETFDQISSVMLPSLLFNYILGVKVPFEKNAICGNKAEEIDNAMQRLAGDNTHQYQIIIPFLECMISPKFRHHIIQNLQKLTPHSFQNMDSLPSISELFATLEKEVLPSPELTAKMFENYEEYIWEKDSETGIGFRRLILDNFEFIIKLFNKKFSAYPEFAKRFEESLRTLQPAVVIDASMLYQILLKMEAAENPDLAFKPSVDFDKPTMYQDKTVTLPMRLDVPKEIYENTHNVYVIDISGSMALNDKIDAIKQEMIFSANRMARKQNQYLTVITYSTDARTVIPRMVVNPLTVVRITKFIEGISVDNNGGTFALTALNEAWKHLRENENINILFATDGRFDDAKDRAQFTRDVQQIYKSNPKIVPVSMKVFGLDLEEEGEEQIYLKTLCCLAEEDSQLIFSNVADITTKLKHLIMSERNRMVSKCTVTLTAGAESYVTSIRPFQSNDPTLRFLDIPQEKFNQLLNAEGKLSKDCVKAKFDVTFDNLETMSFVEEIPLNLLGNVAAKKPSDYEKKCYREEWIKAALYRAGVEKTMALFALSYAEQLRVLEKVQGEAIALGNKEAVEKLQADMQLIAKTWLEEQKFALCAKLYKHTKYKQKASAAEKTNILNTLLQQIAVFSKPVRAYIEQIINQEKMVEEAHTFLLDRSCKLAGVSSQLMFDKIKSPQEQLEVYAKLKKEVIEQQKFDPKLLLPLVEQKIERIWLRAELFKHASQISAKQIKTDTAFNALEMEQQYESLDAVKQLAMQQDKGEAVFKQLNERMGSIYLETRIRELAKCKSEQEFREKLSKEQQLAIYEKIEQEDETSQYVEVMNVLAEKIFGLWVEPQICKTATAKLEKATSITDFRQLDLEKQLTIMEEVKRFAAEFKKDFVPRIEAMIQEITKLAIASEQKKNVERINNAQTAVAVGEGGARKAAVARPRYLKRTRRFQFDRSLLKNEELEGFLEGAKISYPGQALDIPEDNPGEKKEQAEVKPPVIFSINKGPGSNNNAGNNNAANNNIDNNNAANVEPGAENQGAKVAGNDNKVEEAAVVVDQSQVRSASPSKKVV